MTEKCFQCDKPATLVNHTQFAGTHYWCAEHVPAEDRPDCTPLDKPTSLTLNPANLTIKFTDNAVGFTQRPTSYTCEVYYHDDHGHYRATAEGRSAHRAKMDAFNELEGMVKFRAALEQVEQEAQFHPGKTTVDLKSFETPKDRLETKMAKVLNDHFTSTADKNQYLLDKLQEEAAEIIQAVSKIRRFGPDNHHPDRTQTNLQELIGELEDFQAIVWALEEIQYLDPKPSTTSIIKKYNALMG
jgi:hypothetical protein